MIWLFFSLKGRLNRAYFWYGSLALVLAFFIIGFFVQEVLRSVFGIYEVDTAVKISTGLVVWPMFAIGVKRCHDLGRSWWLYLLGFIPVMGLLFVLYFAFFRGTDGPNKYGPDPCYRPDKAFVLKGPRDIQAGPIRHEELSEDQLSRIREVNTILAEVYSLSFEEWVDGFKRDQNPEFEICVWECIACTYQKYCNENTLTPVERQDVFMVMLSCTAIPEDRIIDFCKLKAISEDQARDVMERFLDGAEPPTTIDR